jgi:hypothetical protein
MSQVRVRWHPQQFVNRVRRGMANNLRDGIKLLHKDVIRSIRTQGHRGFHSKPGNPPFRQSGELIKSYRTSVNRAALEAQLFSDSPYARRLELGGHGGGVYIAPRPHLRPALRSRALAMTLTRPV